MLCREVRRLGQPCGGWPVPRLSAKPSPTHLVNLRFEAVDVAGALTIPSRETPENESYGRLWQSEIIGGE